MKCSYRRVVLSLAALLVMMMMCVTNRAVDNLVRLNPMASLSLVSAAAGKRRRRGARARWTTWAAVACLLLVAVAGIGACGTKPPVADFTAQPVSGTAPLTVTFTNQSQHATGYDWAFGDGETSAETDPVHVYGTAGVYTVTLTATGPGGSDVRADVITVHEVVEPPVADFTAQPVSGTAPLTVTFTNLSQHASSYDWAFGDGGTSAETNPVHVYGTAGVYTVTLTATGPGGSDVRADVITVHEAVEPPVADFDAAPRYGEAPLQVVFTNTTQGNATHYRWDFGDGGISLETHPIHAYVTGGTYTVTLVVAGQGGTDTRTRPAYVEVVQVDERPVVTITAPAEGAVVNDSDVPVSGLVSDDGTIVSVWVNDVPATVDGGSFVATVPLSRGNQVLHVVAQDDLGQVGFASRVVLVDGDGPMVGIQSPADRQSVYTRYPAMAVSYSDFYADVDTGTFAAQLVDAGGTVTDVSGDFSVEESHAAGILGSPLAGDTVYTLTVSIADVYGNVGTDSNTFYVPPDPATITPPAAPEGAGWVSGRVYGSDTCNEHLTTCAGLPGVRVTVLSIDHETRVVTDDVPGAIVTGPDGFFAFPVERTGTYALRFEKDGYTYGQREVAVVRERSTAVDEVYLTPLDPATTYCEHAASCHHVSSDGLMQVDIPPGAIRPGEAVTVTATNFEHVEFLPSGSLPPGTWETYAFNLGGNSEITFTRPITVRLQNYREFAPGTRIPLGYWNQHTLQWEHVGVGKVDDAGTWVVMYVEHFSNFDCNAPGSLPGIDGGLDDLTNEDDRCSVNEPGCIINLKSGRMREWVELPPVNLMGQAVAPRLAYDTNRAYPSEVIDLSLNVDVDPVRTQVYGYIQFELYVEGQKTDSMTLAADPDRMVSENPDSTVEVGRYRYLWDGRNAQGKRLPPGIYAYAARLSVPYRGEYYWSSTGRFGGPPDLNRPTGVFVTTTQDYRIEGTIALNTQVDSALGSGWVLEGQQRLTEDEAGRIVVAAAGEVDEYYFELKNRLGDVTQYGTDEPAVTGPAAEVVIAPPPANGIRISGTLTTDTTWDEGAYFVTGGDLIVADGATLTIEPGVTVKVDQYMDLVVQGEFQALGTALNPITFTAYTDGFYEAWEPYVFPVTQNYRPGVMAVDTEGALWIGRDEEGTVVYQYHPDSDTGANYHILDLPLASRIQDIEADSQGQVWFATDYGAAKFDGSDWTVYEPTDGDGPLYGDMSAIAIDDVSGHVWFGLSQRGAQRFSPGEGQWDYYDLVDACDVGPAFEDVPVRSISIDGDGHVWFGAEAGLCELAPGQTPAEDVWTRHNDAAITVVAADRAGNVWMAVDGAGMRGRLANGDWITYTQATGDLLSDDIRDIVVDGRNRKWFVYEDEFVDYGVSVLWPDHQSWFHEQDLLPAGICKAVAASPDGTIWAGTSERINEEGYFWDNRVTHVHQKPYLNETISGGYWGSLQIGGGNPGDSDASRLSHVVVESGGIGRTPGVYLHQSGATLDHVLIRGSAGDGLFALESDGLTMDTVTVEGNEGHGIRLQGNSGTLTMMTVTTRYNGGYGIFTQGEATLALDDSVVAGNAVAARLPANSLLRENTWADNRRNHIEWEGGTLFTSTVWDESVDHYEVLGDVTVSDGVTLTIPPNATVLFGQGRRLQVQAAGTLHAVGTADEPIYFGPLDPDKRWNGVRIGGSGGGEANPSHLSYVIVEGAYQGIRIDGGAPALDHLALIDNRYGLYVNQDSSVVRVRDSNFIGNGTCDVCASWESSVDVRENFWNNVGGPQPGQILGNDVQYVPWLEKPVYLAGLDYTLTNRTATDHARLRYEIGTGMYVRSYPDGREVYFDGEGYHQYTLEPDGRKTAYAYNAAGAVETMSIVLSEEGPDRLWTWTFGYDEESGKLDRITDPAGRVTEFTVDRNGHLARVAFPDESERRFYYDARGLMTQQVDPAGAVTNYVYDAYGRLVEHLGPPREVYDPETGQTVHTQDVKRFTPSDTAYQLINDSTVGDPEAPAPAVLTSTLLVDGVAYGRGGRTGHTNKWGQWLDETDALGRTTTYEWNEANRATGLHWPAGNCMEAEYDEMGNPLRVSRMGPAQCQMKPVYRDPDKQESALLTYERRFHQVKTVTDALGRTTTYHYDYELGLGESGNPVRVEYPPVMTLDGEGQRRLMTPTVEYAYNQWGLLEMEIDERGTATCYEYTQGTPGEAHGGFNPLFGPGVAPLPGLLTQVIRKCGGDGGELITTYKEFDEGGNPTMVIDPAARITRYAYDAWGRVISTTSPSGIVTLKAYDGRGDLMRQMEDYTPDGVTGRNAVTEYAYDANGRLVGQRSVVGGVAIERDIGGVIRQTKKGAGDGQRWPAHDIHACEPWYGQCFAACRCIMAQSIVRRSPHELDPVFNTRQNLQGGRKGLGRGPR